MARDSHCPVADLAPALAVILKQGSPAARSRIADLVESGLAFSAVNVPKFTASRINALAFAIGLAAAKRAKEAAPADLAPAPAAFTESAESVAADMARRACREALESKEGAGRRAYVLDSGVLNCRASYDGDSVKMSWDIEGRPLSRGGAESFISARMASRMGGQS